MFSRRIMLLWMLGSCSHAFLERPWWSKSVRRKSITPSFSTHASDTKEQSLSLDTGVSMQVLWRKESSNNSSSSSNNNNDKNKKPSLVFLHGSFHGAWCWDEHYFAYFAARGFDVVAPSWRGTGGTLAGTGNNVRKKVQIQQHVADLHAFLSRLPALLHGDGAGGDDDGSSDSGVDDDILSVVLICHSFGSLAVMKYLEALYASESQLHPPTNVKLAGIVTMCGVPPSGNQPMTVRYLRRSIVDSWKITMGFALQRCLVKPDLCRDLFFGGVQGGLSDDDLQRYQSYFARDSVATIDLTDLAKQLPSGNTNGSGRATCVDRLPPCLVIGATDDFIVDHEGNEETARYFGLEAAEYVNSPHDVMLGSTWSKGAAALLKWLEQL